MTMKTLSAALLATLSLTAPAWAADNSQTTPQGHWEWQPAPQYGPYQTALMATRRFPNDGATMRRRSARCEIIGR